jgi:hypothetical protein
VSCWAGLDWHADSPRHLNCQTAAKEMGSFGCRLEHIFWEAGLTFKRAFAILGRVVALWPSRLPCHSLFQYRGVFFAKSRRRPDCSPLFARSPKSAGRFPSGASSYKKAIAPRQPQSSSINQLPFATSTLSTTVNQSQRLSSHIT